MGGWERRGTQPITSQSSKSKGERGREGSSSSSIRVIREIRVINQSKSGSHSGDDICQQASSRRSYLFLLPPNRLATRSPLGIEKERNIPPPLDLISYRQSTRTSASTAAPQDTSHRCRAQNSVSTSLGSRSDNVGRATKTRKSTSPRILDDPSAYRMSF